MAWRLDADFVPLGGVQGDPRAQDWQTVEIPRERVKAVARRPARFEHEEPPRQQGIVHPIAESLNGPLQQLLKMRQLGQMVVHWKVTNF